MISPIQSYVFVKPVITEAVGVIQLFRPKREYRGYVKEVGPDTDLKPGDHVVFEPNTGFPVGRDGLLALTDEQISHVII